MPYIAPEVITEAKRMDLLTYLREYEPGELVRFSSNTYTTRTHDSLKISNGKWMWWSRGIGGKSALDYLIKVRGMDFVGAVQTIMGNGSVSFPTCENIKSYEEQPLLLPQKSPTTDVVFDYLFGRGIDYEIINYCLEQELIIESLPYHNAVFIGYNENKEPKYAAYEDDISEQFHRELITPFVDPFEQAEEERIEEEKEQLRQLEIAKVRKVLEMLKPVQRERMIKAILLGMSSRKIAKEEGVYYSVVDKSIAAARKNFKKFYENL